MSLNSAQFEALFTNTFGNGTESFGVAIDPSGADAIGRKGAHTVELLVIQDRAIEWRVDGATFLAWKQYPKDSDARHQNGSALRTAIE